MTSQSADAPMSALPGRYDELFLTLAQQHGSIESLLDSFFEFLYRKTDFYVVTDDPARKTLGFRPGVAQQKVLAAFQKHPLRNIDVQSPSSRPASTPSTTPKPHHAKPTAAKPITTTTATTAPPKSKPIVAAAPVRVSDKGKQLPEGNGGRTDKYTWTQTLDDVSIQVEVPEGTRARDLDCQIRTNHLRVALRGSADPVAVFIDGDLPEKIRADESVWSIENNHTLHISLEKIRPTWWASAVVGDAEIDTSQVDSTRQIGEYDPATQGAIRKAMFDQQQRQLGLPTSDELATERILAQGRTLPDSPI